MTGGSLESRSQILLEHADGGDSQTAIAMTVSGRNICMEHAADQTSLITTRTIVKQLLQYCWFCSLIDMAEEAGAMCLFG